MTTPSKQSLIDDYANKTVKPVYRFTVMPFSLIQPMDCGQVDWDGCSHASGTGYALLDGMAAINVEISKGVPKSAVISELENIIEFIKQATLHRDKLQHFEELANWFDE